MSDGSTEEPRAGRGLWARWVRFANSGPFIGGAVLLVLGSVAGVYAARPVDPPEPEQQTHQITQAGRNEPAPKDLPHLAGDFTDVRTLDATTMRRVVDFAGQKKLGRILAITASPESTELVTGPSGGLPGDRQVEFRPGRAPAYTEATQVGRDPLDDVRTAGDLDVGEVVERARKDLGTKAELSFLQVEHGPVKGRAERGPQSDVVRVRFAADAKSDPQVIVYRLRDLRKLYAEG
ncbi:hypothetical protein NQ038_00185 [Brevibacterium sp. 50QC2O2]|uniref:hypothetical protein n=1 Tax=Brevibacterium sp. 50QC2O2 TaxID=2968459 RepID=UPI00211C4BFB|nr:hypothetical protein [Brevibacterium sp. 50QC2O2]MCQ9387081.1 hypothetical protein [Brevibacterium sp. 50QC2O2]